ncbi:helix-turn-helix domain-containing protein [Sodalis praecaptivus]|uniref:helix-turn-helix domain-containing protein n=1 Tax=Sodalis TaxID=84565 RepID=UPI003B58A91A
MAAVSRTAGLASSILNNALWRHWPREESIIAKALNLNPWDIWPSRYPESDGQITDKE